MLFFELKGWKVMEENIKKLFKRLNNQKLRTIISGVGFYLIYGCIQVIGKDHPLLATICFIGTSGGIIYKLQLFKDIRSLVNKESIIIILGCFALGRLIYHAGSYIASLENGVLNNQAIIENTDTPAILFIVSSVIGAPIVEEMFYRYCIQSNIFDNSFLGVIISSFVFGLAHTPQNFGSWVTYGGMGIVLGLTYYKTHNLTHSVMIHLLNNAWVAELMLLGFSFV